MPILEVLAMTLIAYAGLSEICRIYISNHMSYAYWIPRETCAPRVNVKKHTRSWTLSELANSRAFSDSPHCLQIIKTDEVCAICLDNFAETDAKAAPEASLSEIRRCGHVFCETCIHHWLSDHRTCPLCNQDVTEPAPDPRHFKQGEEPLPRSDWLMLHQA